MNAPAPASGSSISVDRVSVSNPNDEAQMIETYFVSMRIDGITPNNFLRSQWHRIGHIWHHVASGACAASNAKGIPIHFGAMDDAVQAIIDHATPF